MNRKKILSAVLAASILMAAAGCSKQDEGAVKTSKSYVDNVLDVDLEKMEDMLKDKDAIDEYELDDRSMTGLTSALQCCEYEQKEYRSAGDEITIGYTLTLPDLDEVKDNEYGCYADLVDSLDELGEAEYDLEITLVEKKGDWLVKDAESTLELYGDILEGLDKAEFDYILGYEGLLASLEEHIPELADELYNSRPLGGEYNVCTEGFQVVIGEYDDSDAAYEMFAFIVECHTGETPSEDEHYCYLGVNGRASGIAWRDNVVVHIYDNDGQHQDEVNAVLEDIQDML